MLGIRVIRLYATSVAPSAVLKCSAQGNLNSAKSAQLSCYCGSLGRAARF